MACADTARLIMCRALPSIVYVSSMRGNEELNEELIDHEAMVSSRSGHIQQD